MYRLKGFAAAGLFILKRQNPAILAKHDRDLCVLVAGSIVLLSMISPLVGPSGSSLPVPPRKPDMAALILNGNISQASYKADKAASLKDGAYLSPMANGQMDLYRDIFRLQAAGSLKDADTVIARLKDKSLMGHVLAQRYLHASYKAGFEELKSWLELYADHPQAPRIAKLANARMPSGHDGALVKVSYSAPGIEELDVRGMGAKTYDPQVKRTAAQNVMAKDMIAAVRRQVQQYEPSTALRQFNESEASLYLDSVEKDRIRAIIASGYLYAGKTAEAEKLAGQAMISSGERAPMAGWVHGLAKWRTGQYKQAAKSFEVAANSEYSTGWMVSAASYWAARANQKSGNNRRAGHWLEKAADYPRTFYGLLALQGLGRKPDLNWDMPHLSASEEREIMNTTAGQRAEKLLAAGEVTLAEAEINTLYVRGDAERKKTLLAYAYDRRLPSLTMKLAHAVSTKDDIFDAALYPSMPWSPNKGFRIDRALLHAIIRQESRFNAAAENKGSGATGLMQLMPGTAHHVAGVDMFRDYEGRTLLKTAEVSLDLGQDYVEELLNNKLVGQDLLSLAIAYNAGPGRLQKWKAERADIDDPLLFIETIPFAETRTYVERVMSNYWIYRMRFDQPNDSMVALANGKWARYAAHDKGAVKFASAD